jgi:acetolactate synthase-1/2/3 large subunit
MNGAEYIAREVERRGVTHVFELVGGMITFLIDALREKTAVQVISMHHEQGAGFAAEGFGRMVGIPGVALATSGPGATNLLTAIGSCHFDSTPAVFITGQVNRAEMKGDRAIRQLGFQETDIVTMAKPITKMAELVMDPASLPKTIDRAFRVATQGRPGPVLLDVPMDVQRAEVEPSRPMAAGVSQEPRSLDEFWVDFQRCLQAASRPLILAGGGLRCARVVEPFRRLVAGLGIPVVHSLMGVDVLASDDPMRVGLIGSYGNRWANLAISECDLMLVLGSRLDVRQTGSDTVGFKGDRRIFHVDCEMGEMNNRVTGCSALVSGLGDFIGHALARPGTWAGSGLWRERLADLKSQWPDTEELRGVEGINPNALMRHLSQVAGSAAAFVADVGQHQQWAAQSLQLRPDQRFLTSGGMGAMGFALPAAIGASLATGRQVVVIAGDGGFQLNIQELQTIVRLGLPVKMLVIDNGCHGMVRQFQESYFKGRYHSTMWGYSAPDFERVAAAYGVPSATVISPSEIDHGLARCFADPGSPFLLVVKVHAMANAYPKLAFGRPISQMEPLVRSIEMEGT